MLSIIKQRIEYAKHLGLKSIEVPEDEMTEAVQLALYLDGGYTITVEEYDEYDVLYNVSWD